MKNSLQVLVLATTLTTSFTALADTAWLQCEVRLSENNELVGKARSNDDYQCKDNCNLIYWDNELRLAVNAVFQGPDRLLIKAKDYTNSRKAEKTVAITPELQTCKGNILQTGEYTINCEYCQQD